MRTPRLVVCFSLLVSLCVSKLLCEVTVSSAQYVNVFMKMHAFCRRMYTKADDKVIEEYTKCFVNFMKTDMASVKTCRMMVYKSNKAMKTADCNSSMIAEAQQMRSCVKTAMMKKDPKFNLDQVDRQELKTKEFYACLEKAY